MKTASLMRRMGLVHLSASCFSFPQISAISCTFAETANGPTSLAPPRPEPDWGYLHSYDGLRRGKRLCSGASYRLGTPGYATGLKRLTGLAWPRYGSSILGHEPNSAPSPKTAVRPERACGAACASTRNPCAGGPGASLLGRKARRRPLSRRRGRRIHLPWRAARPWATRDAL